jgi:hypothetical protein
MCMAGGPLTISTVSNNYWINFSLNEYLSRKSIEYQYKSYLDLSFNQ